MTHPFDGYAYPWHRPDAIRLKQMLRTVFDDPMKIEILYKQSGPHPEPLTPGNADRMWSEVLQHVARAGQIRRLCELILNQPLAADARAAVEQVLHAVPEVEELAVEDGVIVLDRIALRGLIARLTPASAPLKTLVVRGDPGSGKSHGRHLFERAARSRNAQPVYLCADIVASLDEVLRELFGALHAMGEIPEPGETTGSAYHKHVWRTLREIAGRERRALWIAIDDLAPAADGGPLLDSEIREFFDQLVPMFLNPTYRDWFRLMLIHYPEGRLPTRWRRESWAEDRTAPDDVRPEHVADELRAWWRRRGQVVVEEELDSLVTAVFAEADKVAEQAGRLQRIDEALVQVLEPPREGH